MNYCDISYGNISYSNKILFTRNQREVNCLDWFSNYEFSNFQKFKMHTCIVQYMYYRNIIGVRYMVLWHQVNTHAHDLRLIFMDRRPWPSTSTIWCCASYQFSSVFSSEGRQFSATLPRELINWGWAGG